MIKEQIGIFRRKISLTGRLKINIASKYFGTIFSRNYYLKLKTNSGRRYIFDVVHHGIDCLFYKTNFFKDMISKYVESMFTFSFPEWILMEKNLVFLLHSLWCFREVGT